MIKNIIIHHTGALYDTLEGDNEWHRQRWNSISSLGFYLGYHYFIDKKGVITQTRKDDEQGIHTRGQNESSIGIACQGNFQLEAPSEAQIASLLRLTDRLKLTYGIKDIKAHREFSKTECCGEELYKWVLEQRISWLKKLIEFFLKGR